MSILKGKTINEISSDNYRPKIKWINGTKQFVVSVLDMYTKDGSFFNTYISEEDLYRLINADKGVKYGFWFNEDDEKGELDDDTYLGISYIQARYYLSISVLKEAKRLWKRTGRNGQAWLVLKKRVPKGGRLKGTGINKSFENLSIEEQERLKSLAENYEKIKINCYAKDWVNEYVELERDMAIYKGEPFIGKKACIQKFTAERKKYLEETPAEEIRKRTKTL